MKWTGEHDIVLVREILLFEPFSYKHGSEERGKCWEQIAVSLNGFREDGLYFKVTKRSVRDRYNSFEQNIKKQRHHGKIQRE